jgi:hypothetical protein
MPLSQVIIPSDGSTTLLVVDFALGIINSNEVTVRAGNEVDGAGNPLFRTFTLTSPTLMQVDGDAPPIGVDWIITRTVPKDVLLVDWSDGDPITGKNLDTAQLQALHMTHEALDLGARAIKVDAGQDGLIITRGTEGQSVVFGPTNTLIPGVNVSDLDAKVDALEVKLDASVADIHNSVNIATAAAESASVYATRAETLVSAAQAGYTGFSPDMLYDFGFVSDQTTEFDRDFGSVA